MSERSLKIQGRVATAFAVAFLLFGELVAAHWDGVTFVLLICRLLTAALVLYALLCLPVLRTRLPRLTSVLRILWLAAAALLIVSFIIIEVVLISNAHSDFSDIHNPPAAYMIVLGAGVRGETPSHSLSSRLDAALPVLLANPDMLCVLSGGQGEGEDITEALAMWRYLTRRGVPSEQLLLEERSTNTAQNAAFSLELLNERLSAEGKPGMEGQDIIVCSNGFHLFRARWLLKREGVVPHALEAPMQLQYLYFTGHLREYFSVLFMWREG